MDSRTTTAYESFSDFINSGGYTKINEFADLVTKDHRALQADTFRLMFKCFEIWHDMYENGNYDARNQNELKIAFEIIESLKDKKLY